MLINNISNDYKIELDYYSLWNEIDIRHNS